MGLIGADGPPLLPNGDEARDWAARELSDPAYRAAEPTGFDRFVRDVVDQLVRLLQQGPGEGLGQLAAVVLVVVVVAIIAAAFLIWGRPRLSARARASQDGLFGGDAVRSAAEHRRAARAAADRGEWDEAVLERMRAIARALAERLIVDAPPGATVQAFAAAAASAFPARADELAAAARSFDDVRYLRRPGTPEAYRGLERLDESLEHERPLRDEALV